MNFSLLKILLITCYLIAIIPTYLITPSDSGNLKEVIIQLRNLSELSASDTTQFQTSIKASLNAIRGTAGLNCTLILIDNPGKSTSRIIITKTPHIPSSSFINTITQPSETFCFPLDCSYLSIDIPPPKPPPLSV